MDINRITEMDRRELREVRAYVEDLEVKKRLAEDQFEDLNDKVNELERLLETEKSKLLGEKRKSEGMGKFVSAAIVVDGDDVVTVEVDGWWTQKQLLAVHTPLARAVRASHVKHSNELAEKIRKEKQAEAEALRIEQEAIEKAAEKLEEYEQNEEPEETNEIIDNLTQGDSDVQRNDTRNGNGTNGRLSGRKRQ